MRWENEMAKTVIFSYVAAFFRVHSRAMDEKKNENRREKGVFTPFWFPIASSLLFPIGLAHQDVTFFKKKMTIRADGHGKW
jgi:hypothetical protein